MKGLGNFDSILIFFKIRIHFRFLVKSAYQFFFLSYVQTN